MNYYSKDRSLLSALIIGVLMVLPVLVVLAQLSTAAETGSSASSGKVLIVSNVKKPDDPVIMKITQMLRKEGDYVKLGAGTNLKGMQANKYGAIIIINFLEDKMKDRKVEVFADENVQKRVVLLNAIGDYLSPDKTQASSRTVKAEKIASDIVERTKAILSNHGVTQVETFHE